jgi:hypothetical protein
MGRTFGFGIGSLVVGLGLYVAAMLVTVNYYDEQPHPSWLVVLSVLAAVLVVAGLLVMANVAIRVYRERS